MAKQKDDLAADTADDSVNYDMGVINADGYGDEDKSLLDEYTEEIDEDEDEDARKKVLARGQDKEEVVPGSTRDEDPWAKDEKYDSDEWPEDYE